MRLIGEPERATQNRGIAPFRDGLKYRYLTDIDAELAVLEEKLAKARLLKQGLMQELLTGRIRLVNPGPSVVNAGC